MFHGNLPVKTAQSPATARDLAVLTPGGESVQVFHGGVKQIRADTDIDAVAEWLSGFTESPKTFKAYRRESERFLRWVTRLRPGASLKRLMLDDVRAYEAFLRQIPADWISTAKEPRESAAWRPFAGQLSAKSLRYSMRVLMAMLKWLQAAEYSASNPFALDKKRYREPETANLGISRYLSESAISTLFEAIDWMPAGFPYEKREKTRIKLAISLYYDSALRLSEPIGANFGSIQQDSEGFWLHVVGKGNKLARVPLSARSLAAIDDYKITFGLPLIVDPETPLLLAMRGDRRRATVSTMGDAVNKALLAASKLARETGNIEEADQLIQASPHYLRHSRVSHLISSGATVDVVRKLARHASLATTSQYSHAEARALQELVGVAPFSRGSGQI